MKLPELSPSHREINLSAKRMVLWEYGTDENAKEADFDIVAAFRATHAYPLRVVTTLLRQHARRVDSSASVYARTKRMISIITKLQRTRSMQATTMQDMGGCRAVVDTIESVAKLTEQFRQISPQLDDPREYNYIANPKPDGYRSVHFVVKYRPKSRRTSIYQVVASKFKLDRSCNTSGQLPWKRLIFSLSKL